MQKRGNFKFLNKKATIAIRQSLIHLGMFVLAAVVLLLMVHYVSSIEKNSDFEMLYFGRDLALLINAIYSAPGNVEYVYLSDKFSLSVYNIEFKPLSPEDEKPVVKIIYKGVSKSYPYAKGSQGTDSFLIQAPKSIKFSKNNQQLTVTKNE